MEKNPRVSQTAHTCFPRILISYFPAIFVLTSLTFTWMRLRTANKLSLRTSARTLATNCNCYPTEMPLKGHYVVSDGGGNLFLMSDFSLFMHAGTSSHTPGTLASVIPQTTTEGRCQPSAPAPLWELCLYVFWRLKKERERERERKREREGEDWCLVCQCWCLCDCIA